MPHPLSFSKYKKLFFLILFVSFFSFSFGTPSNESLKRDSILKSQKVKIDPKLRLGAQVGYGYRFANRPSTGDPNMNKHLKKLKNNLSFGADLSYYLKDYLGVGIKYNANVTHVVTENVSYMFQDGTKVFYNQFSELIGTHYLGAYLLMQYFVIPQKQCIFVNVGAGYLRHTNDVGTYKLKYPSGKERIVHVAKNSAAFFAEIGYDFFITKHFAIGLQTSALIELKKVLLTDPESISHIDVSLAFRFYNL